MISAGLPAIAQSHPPQGNLKRGSNLLERENTEALLVQGMQKLLVDVRRGPKFCKDGLPQKFILFDAPGEPRRTGERYSTNKWPELSAK